MRRQTGIEMVDREVRRQTGIEMVDREVRRQTGIKMVDREVRRQTGIEIADRVVRRQTGIEMVDREVRRQTGIEMVDREVRRQTGIEMADRVVRRQPLTSYLTVSAVSELRALITAASGRSSWTASHSPGHSHVGPLDPTQGNTLVSLSFARRVIGFCFTVSVAVSVWVIMCLYPCVCGVFQREAVLFLISAEQFQRAAELVRRRDAPLHRILETLAAHG